jgi:hypothetical protein
MKRPTLSISAMVLLALLNARAVTAAVVNVIDSRGRVVGEYVPNLQENNQGQFPFQAGIPADDFVLIKVSGIWFSLPVNSSGFQIEQYALGYTTSTCTGTEYLLMQGNFGELRHFR